MTILPKLTGIKEAVALADSKTSLAGKLGVSKTTVQNWVKQGYVPLEYIEPISQLYGISPARLCNPLILKIFPVILEKESSK